jgi:hypothetical protein
MSDDDKGSCSETLCEERNEKESVEIAPAAARLSSFYVSNLG